MNKLTLLAFFFIFHLSTCLCQSLYLKTVGAFNYPINKQPSPNYFSYKLSEPFFSKGITIYTDVEDFSLAEGFNFQFAGGYSFNDFISLEVGVSYFTNTRRNFKHSPGTVVFTGETNWQYNNVGVVPTLVIGQSFARSTVNITLFSGIGISSLDVTASFEKDYRKYTFDKSISFSYGYGLEYLYKVSPLIQFVANVGVNNSFYTPKHTKLTSSSSPLQNLNIYEKEIKYVHDINNLDVIYNNVQSEAIIIVNEVPYYSNPDKPEIRMRETLKLNSFYVGIGLKFNLKKNEKE